MEFTIFYPPPGEVTCYFKKRVNLFFKAISHSLPPRGPGHSGQNGWFEYQLFLFFFKFKYSNLNSKIKFFSNINFFSKNLRCLSCGWPFGSSWPTPPTWEVWSQKTVSRLETCSQSPQGWEGWADTPQPGVGRTPGSRREKEGIPDWRESCPAEPTPPLAAATCLYFENLPALVLICLSCKAGQYLRPYHFL